MRSIIRRLELFTDILVLLSCLLWAMGIVVGTKLCQRTTAFAATFWAFALRACACLPSQSSRRGASRGTCSRSQTWAAMLHITVGATVIAYVAWFWVMSRGGVTRVAMV